MPSPQKKYLAADNRSFCEYVVTRSADENGFQKSISSAYKRKLKWSNAIISSLILLISIPFKPRPKQIKYFFWETKFEEIVATLPKKEVCIVGGPKQLIFCVINRLSFIPAVKIWRPFYNELQSGPSNSNDLYISSLLEDLSKSLSYSSAPDAIFIVENDSLPAQRAAIQAARMAGIARTVCIQHGIYQRKAPRHILDGWLSDTFLVIDQNQKDLLIEKGMPSEKIRVLGFHSSPYRPHRPLTPAQDRKVCLIGQPWDKYDKAKGDRYLFIFKKLSSIINHLGHTVSFKPHPWERGSHYLCEMQDITDISMQQALENYDVFISLTSTALLEANLANRISIQILDNNFESDNFSKFSSIISLTADDPNLESQIKESIRSTPSPQPSASRPLAERFLKAISTSDEQIKPIP